MCGLLAQTSLLTSKKIISVGQSAATGLAISDGLGLHSSSLSEVMQWHLHRKLFASDFLFLLASALAKLACAFLVYRLTRPVKSVTPVRVAMVPLALWSVASVVAITVPAGSTKMWDASPQASEALV